MYEEERTKKKKKHKKHKDKDRKKTNDADDSPSKHRHKHKHKNRSVSNETTLVEDEQESYIVGGLEAVQATRTCPVVIPETTNMQQTQITPEKKTLRLVFKMSNPSGQIETVRTAATVIEPVSVADIEEPPRIEPVEVIEPKVIDEPLFTEIEPPSVDSFSSIETENKKHKKSKHKKHHKHKRSLSTSSSSPQKKHKHHHHHRKKATQSLRIKVGPLEINKTFESQQSSEEINGQQSSNAANDEFPVETLNAGSKCCEVNKSPDLFPEMHTNYNGRFGINYAEMNLPFSPPNDGLSNFDSNRTLFPQTFHPPFSEPLSPNKHTQQQTSLTQTTPKTFDHLPLDSLCSVTRTQKSLSPQVKCSENGLTIESNIVLPLFSPKSHVNSAVLVENVNNTVLSPLNSLNNVNLNIPCLPSQHHLYKPEPVTTVNNKLSQDNSSGSNLNNKKPKKPIYKSKHSQIRVDINPVDDFIAPKPQPKIKISLNLISQASEIVLNEVKHETTQSTISNKVFSPKKETLPIFEFKRPFDPSTITSSISTFTKITISTASIKTETTKTTSLNTTHIALPSVIEITPSTMNNHFDKKAKIKPRDFTQLLVYLLKLIQKKDAQQFFAKPVSDLIAPGYSTIIQHPMDLSTIRKRITENAYKTLGDFQADIKLMCDNALKYNQPETIYYKAATKLWHYTKSKLLKRDALLSYAKNYTAVTSSELSLLPSTSILNNSKTYVNGFSIGIQKLSDLQASILMPPPQTPPPLNLKKFKNKIKNSQSSLLKGSSQIAKTINEEDKKKKDVEEVNKIYYDGLTANEIVTQNKIAALKARKRLLQKHPGGVFYSVLKESQIKSVAKVNPDSKRENIVQAHVLPLSYGKKLNTRPLDLSQFYKPTENGRINCDVLPDLIMPKIKPPTVITTTTNTPPINTGNSRSRSNKADASKTAPTKPMLTIPQPPSPPMPTKPIFKLPEDESSIKKAEFEQLAQSLLQTYGNNEFGLEYAFSIGKFAQDSDYTSNLVTQLMNILTLGKHRGVAAKYTQLLKEFSI